MSLTGESFRFVSFLRACVRAVWLHSGIRTQKKGPPLPLFPFGVGSSPFSPYPTLQNLLLTLVGLIGLLLLILHSWIIKKHFTEVEQPRISATFQT